MSVNVNLWNLVKPATVSQGEPHPGQKEVLYSPARFKVVICGRRWGKSVFAVINLIAAALSKPNGLYWYIAPTYRQAKTIAWRLFLHAIRLFPKFFQDKCKIEKNHLIIEFPNGSIIELKGAQDPESLVGSGLDGVVLDEYAMETYGTSPVWQEAIRPALADKQGWAIFITTPRGYNHAYEIYDYAASGTDPDWQAWRMPTSTNPYIPAKELEAAKREIGEDLYSQEFEAQFMKRSGLVYKEFDRHIHVIDPLPAHTVGSQWSLEVGVDFGSSHPTAAIFVLFDHIHDIAYVVDEHYKAEQTIEKNAAEMKAIENKWLAILKQRSPKVRWGDSQGKQEILEYAKVGYPLTPTLKGAGSVDVGINDVRKRLEKDLILQRPKIFVCRNCVNTIREFENYTWTGSDDSAIEVNDIMRLANKRADKPRKIFDDAMDALRYVIQYHTPPGEDSYVRRGRGPRNPITGV